ncbi:MAG TPA: choice-of-anchor L domain-containing protein, partial [Chitinophagales bacterium]|nr:choice-of-anchor L domain-containing protein [Chitinophagales bacterium]
MTTFYTRTLNRLFVAVALFCAGITASQAQITWTTGYTADSLAGYLAGPGVEIDNAVIDCYNLAIGMFDCVDCNVGIDSGVILTTGRVSNIAGPNNSGSTGTNNGWPGDPDLNAYPGVGTTNDACALEFDVFSPGDSLKFEYVFGSDEYPEYVFSINDAFIFMLSGPGYPVATNIALIPGTALPVTIDNVNATTNPAYYIANGTGGTGIYATDPYYIEYDGFTVVMTAEAVVTPCEWYHLKLVIGDESDFVWDSGVFLKAGSLTTNLLADFTYGGVPFGGTAEFCSTDP